MSSPVNAFFKIHLNGQQTGSTPQLLVSGTLHCVETATAKYLPVAYYTDGATANDNSLTNIRVASDAFGFQNGLLSSPADGSGNKFHIVTYGFTLTVNNAGVIVFAYPSLTTPTYTYDLSITFLELTESLTVPVPSYNELDSDVVLTTASPTAWNRPQPVGNDIVIKSNVLTLIYAALYKEGLGASTVPAAPNERDKYIILGNTDDFQSDANTSPESTSVWQFDNDAGSGMLKNPYDATTGQFRFVKSGATTTLSCQRVDEMLKGIAPNLLQANDTIDITVNGIDSDTRNLYTTTFTYTGIDNKADQYPANLFAGLIEKNPAAYASKQAICIAVSKYNLGTGLNTTQNPPFQFSYKKSGLFKVLDEVVLDFTKYYYIVYHFALPSSFVRALRLFSKPTTNADALKDYVVIAGKNDAYVDLELPEDMKPSSGTYTTFEVKSTGASSSVTVNLGGSPSSSTYQFFTLESELYGGGRTESTTFGKRLRVHLGKLDATTSKIEIEAVHSDSTKSFKGSISKRNILNLQSAIAAGATTASFIELQKLPTWSTTYAAQKKTFNDDISQWDIKAMCDTSGATSTDFSDLLSGFESFNQPLGNWNTTYITNMDRMFKGAKSFNQPINTWKTGAVASMVSMFEGALSFNQSLSDWSLANVASTASMFKGATSFNGLVSRSRSTGVVANSMFEGATSFNRPLSAFKVTSCTSMFKNASAFNQSWEVSDSSGTGLILTHACTDLSAMFQNAISLVAFASTHSLPTAVTTTQSMFEGASSWNCALVSTGNTSLVNTSSMYKGASAFNSAVSIYGITGSSLNFTSMFEGALSMNSQVEFIGGTGAESVTLNSMFKEAIVFNKDVLFGDRKILSAKRMFQGAVSYGNDDESGSQKPMLGSKTNTGDRRYYIVHSGDASGVAPFEYMFDGTRFDDTVVGTAPADCSYMFAGAQFFNTPLGSGFMGDENAHGTRKLTGMFQDATKLEVSPFPNDSSGALSFLATVRDLTSMFEGATLFNPNIAAWGASGRLVHATGRSLNMSRMFHSATSFNQDLKTSWPHVAGATMTDMFTNASAYAYDDISW